MHETCLIIIHDPSFSSIYANYADIFYHRSMEKDKLSILDVCGAYGLKDIKRLDGSEMNKPARDVTMAADSLSWFHVSLRKLYGLYVYILS